MRDMHRPDEGVSMTTAELTLDKARVDLIDVISMDTLRDLAAQPGPHVSLYLPTHRDLPDLRHDALAFRACVEEARAALAAEDVPGHVADALLNPLDELVADTPFWARQAEGLAVFAHPGGTLILRLPSDVPRRVVVGPHPHLRPLVPLATGADEFYLLALSLGDVRLFAGTQGSIHELSLGTIPASVADMERRHQSEPEHQHQHQPRSDGVARFHGHGGSEYDAVAADKFFLEVATGLRERVGASTRLPILVAGVAEHLPALRARNLLPTLVDEVVPGNADHLAAAELHERAWPVIAPILTGRCGQEAERLGALHGTGRLLTDPAQILQAAQEGRVDTLVLAPADRADRDVAARADLDVADRADVDAAVRAELDAALVAALGTGADLSVATLPEGVRVAAVLRY